MTPHLDRQPQNEIDGLYYHLITAQEQEQQRDFSRLHAPASDPNPDYDYHPDDLADLVRWERQTNHNIALWLLLMTVVSVVVVPFAPVFTPVIAIVFALLSAVFYLRAQASTDTNIEKALDRASRFPQVQWMGASLALTMSAIVYLFAVSVPYSPVPASVQTLLFLLAMNFTIYTPIALMRVIRQRTLRKKHRSDN